MNTTNFPNSTPKTGLVVLAHGKKLSSNENVLLISVYDADWSHEMILSHLNTELTKMGAKHTNGCFSEPMDFDSALMLAEEKSQAIEKCLSA